MNGIIGVLQQHREGLTQDALSDALQELVAAVSNEGKGGHLTITLAVRPRGKGDGLDVSIEHKLKLPKETPGVAIFFATPDNNLTRKDPRQSDLPLQTIPATVHKGLAS